ncbi:hypothetical protein C0199_01110 [Candidatus Bathyarchaeota archaeon]|nr:MAG: hypothetical protein C0199_01110 [Candidatus Bathyarchaeota archaeon]
MVAGKANSSLPPLDFQKNFGELYFWLVWLNKYASLSRFPKGARILGYVFFLTILFKLVIKVDKQPSSYPQTWESISK